ncbi:MAG: CoA transferase [Actinobacteria bacterium]|nr:CoA transferase [Actinomycetota bacterium]
MSAGPLAGTRVVDAATLLAGPLIATRMADFGAEVIKVEHPRGDTLRELGWNDGGTSVYWKTASRNKRCCTLDLGLLAGQELMRELARGCDVLIENFRPGTMERWGLGWETLHDLNPGLIMVRVTGFGQDGPYSALPGFGTLAEAMSGLASVLGDRDRPPIVPPLPAADAITSAEGAFAVMAALYRRDAGEGGGQLIDLSLLESMVSFMAPQVSAYDRLGLVAERDGSQAPFSSPRGVYRTSDDGWLALSTSAQSVADRLFAAIGRPELAEDPRFSSTVARLEHREEVDGYIAEWVAVRPLAEAVDTLRDADVAAAPVYTAADVADDEHLRARGALVRVPDPEGGTVLMHNALPRLSETPGEVREAGRPLGADNDYIYGDLLGLGPDRLAELNREGVI